MVQIENLWILTSILFLVLVELVAIARDAPVKTEPRIPLSALVDIDDSDRTDMNSETQNLSIGRLLVPSYDSVEAKERAIWLSGLYREISHRFVKIGRFGFLHGLISTLLYASIALLLFFIDKPNRSSISAAILALILFWLILPVLEVANYDNIVRSHIRPISIDFHFMTVFLLVVILLALHALRIIVDAPFIVLQMIGVWVILFYYYQGIPIYVGMVVEEIKISEQIQNAAESKEEESEFAIAGYPKEFMSTSTYYWLRALTMSGLVGIGTILIISAI